MRYFLKRFNELFSKLGQKTVFGFVLVLVGLLGYIDYATGFEVSTSFLYLVPIFISTWYVTVRAGYSVTFFSLTVWAIANYLAGETFSNELIRYWNISIRMAAFFLFAWLLNELKLALQIESNLARTDSLTGIKNHREFHIQAELELIHARRSKQPFSVVYFDLDSFKKINDEQGHSAGDQLLQNVAHIVSNIIRKSDLFARLGGDEFALLLPNTAEDGARRVVQKIECAVADEMVRIQSPVMLSMGVVTFKSSPKTVDEMINKADMLMYQAKSMGKGKSIYLVIE